MPATPVIIVPSGKAIPVRYAGTAPVPIVTASSPLSLSRALHHGAVVNLRPGATLSVDYAAVGAGFVCIVVNDTGADLTPTLTGFSQATLRNALNLTRIAANGMATLIANSMDGGATARLRAAGELV